MTWTDADECRELELARAEFAGPSLAEHISEITPHEPPPRHLRRPIEIWEATRVRPVRALFEMPPGHAKTVSAWKAFSWRLRRDPAVTHGYITYGLDLARSKSRIGQEYAESAGVRLHPKMRNLQEWRTRWGGGVIATSIGGAFNGSRIEDTGVVVFDDFFSSRKEAESVAAREEAWSFFSTVAFTRIRPTSSVIVQCTRWHEDDPIGRILKLQAASKLKGPPWERVRLRAIARAGEDDGTGREPGEALWPAICPVSHLDELRPLLGDYDYDALYDQDPRTKGSKLFLEPVRFRLQEWFTEWKTTPHRILIAVDPAATAKTSADHSTAYVLAARGRGKDLRIWVVDGFRAQITIPELVRRLRALQRVWKGAPVVVEAVGGFKAVPQTLQELDPGLRIHEVHPSADKFTRALPVSAAWNAGRVAIPLDAPWSAELIRVCQAFTGVNDKEDDDVDAIAHGFTALGGVVDHHPGAVANNAPFG